MSNPNPLFDPTDGVKQEDDFSRESQLEEKEVEELEDKLVRDEPDESYDRD